MDVIGLGWLDLRVKWGIEHLRVLKSSHLKTETLLEGEAWRRGANQGLISCLCKVHLGFHSLPPTCQHLQPSERRTVQNPRCWPFRHCWALPGRRALPSPGFALVWPEQPGSWEARAWAIMARLRQISLLLLAAVAGKETSGFSVDDLKADAELMSTTFEGEECIKTRVIKSFSASKQSLMFECVKKHLYLVSPVLSNLLLVRVLGLPTQGAPVRIQCRNPQRFLDAFKLCLNSVFLASIWWLFTRNQAWSCSEEQFCVGSDLSLALTHYPPLQMTNQPQIHHSLFAQSSHSLSTLVINVFLDGISLYLFDQSINEPTNQSINQSINVGHLLNWSNWQDRAPLGFTKSKLLDFIFVSLLYFICTFVFLIALHCTWWESEAILLRPI